MFTFNKKTKCNKPNIPIAYFIEDDKPKKIYYTECKCKDADDKFSEFQSEAELIPLFSHQTNESDQYVFVPYLGAVKALIARVC